MKVASKRRVHRKKTRVTRKYKSSAELFASPEWKRYIADHTRKHDRLMYTDIINKNKYKRGQADG